MKADMKKHVSAITIFFPTNIPALFSTFIIACSISLPFFNHHYWFVFFHNHIPFQLSSEPSSRPSSSQPSVQFSFNNSTLSFCSPLSRFSSNSLCCLLLRQFVLSSFHTFSKIIFIKTLKKFISNDK